MGTLKRCRECADYLHSIGIECGGCPLNPEKEGLIGLRKSDKLPKEL